jgi:hypothetical protein
VNVSTYGGQIVESLPEEAILLTGADGVAAGV